ncbi:Aspartyl-tRNA synthetase cytoplasmic [Fasciola gigantica]|uniref:Aspartyl-tRNA synthetase cytoplasmic n=1 Tax=Fasciola gigantica TaxID=46835 RepID=A0A504YH52_FASGI|nr:Aspartyl-tRNA synthetase cytoplasmic [Fasciola gigantica]
MNQLGDNPGTEKLSKKALRKLNREVEKLSVEDAKPHDMPLVVLDDEGIESATASYGILPLHQSQCEKGPDYVDLYQLSSLELENKHVWIRGRLHRSRMKGKLCFFVVRFQACRVQNVLSVSTETPKEMLTFVAG